ncbi:hypothetical protein JTB14_003983 [Gonioctena quinquepunctata]|nr:hypothetical protein JTB14_003983 [Gonioctena quinquepunctata]
MGNICLKSLSRHKNFIRNLEIQLQLLKGVPTQPTPIYSNSPPPIKKKNYEASAEKKGIVVTHQCNSSTGAIPKTTNVKSSTKIKINTDGISKDEGK